MTENAKTFEFNGKTLTMDEVTAQMALLKSLQGLEKAAKKAGIITKTVKEAKVKGAEYVLLAGNFTPVITSNLDVIKKLFAATIDADKPYGNIGITVATEEDCEFDIQILSKAARKEQQNEAKKAKEAKNAEAKQLKEDTEAAKKEGMSLEDYLKIKYPEVEPEA